MLESAFAGLVAALCATFILGIARYVHHWSTRRQDVRHLREILLDGRKLVMDAEDTFHENMNATSSADTLRAAQYNTMIRRLDIALEKWLVSLSHDQRMDVLLALDWYHTASIHAVKKGNEAVFVEVPDGKWPTTGMSLQHARDMFDNLQRIKWLGL